MPFTLAQGKSRTWANQVAHLTPFEVYIFNSCLTDPLVHHGRHFGRTVHALCNVQALLTNGLLRIGELAGEPEEAFTYEYAPFSTRPTLYLTSSLPSL